MSSFTDIFVSGLARVSQQVSAQFFSFGGPSPLDSFTPNEAPGLYNVFADPSVSPGYAAPEGSVALLSDSPFGVYQKTGAGITAWTLLAPSGGVGPVAPTTLRLSSVITPPAITGVVNNYAPTGGNAAAWWRLSSSASAMITGIAAQATGILLFVENIGAFSISFSDSTGSSTAANRFITPGAQTWTLPPGGSAILVYDAGARWRFFSLATNILPATTVVGDLTQSGGDVSITADVVADIGVTAGAALSLEATSAGLTAPTSITLATGGDLAQLLMNAGEAVLTAQSGLIDVGAVPASIKTIQITSAEPGVIAIQAQNATHVANRGNVVITAQGGGFGEPTLETVEGGKINLGASLADLATAFSLTLDSAPGVPVSPSGASRIKYDNGTKQLLQSIDAGAYTPLGAPGVNTIVPVKGAVASTNFSTNGTLDWIYPTSAIPYQRATGVNAKVFGYGLLQSFYWIADAATPISGVAAETYSSNAIDDQTGNALSTTTVNGYTGAAVGSGFRIVVPAGPTPRTVRLYVYQAACDVVSVAEFMDGSGVTANVVNLLTSGVNFQAEFTFSSPSYTPLVIVTYITTSFGGANIFCAGVTVGT